MRQPIRHRLFCCTTLLLCLGVAIPALARKKRTPPNLQLIVKEGKNKLGTEVLRTKRGETKTYHSTKTPMRHRKRSFTHRTHTILNAKGALETYDRWLDVKGATLRIRVFRFKDKFKKVEFSQEPGKKNKVKDIDVKAPLVVLDERSPTLLDLAIERFQGHKELNWVRADNLQTGTMTLQIERLVDAAGKRWSRYLLEGKNLKASVLRDPDGKAVEIITGWGFSAVAKGKRGVPKLTAAPATAEASDAAATPTTNSAAPAGPVAKEPAGDKKAEGGNEPGSKKQ